LYKKKVWKIARAHIEADFNEACEKMHKTDLDALKWLLPVPKETWTRSHFTDSSTCDLIHNNISECFNSFCL